MENKISVKLTQPQYLIDLSRYNYNFYELTFDNDGLTKHICVEKCDEDYDTYTYILGTFRESDGKFIENITIYESHEELLIEE